MLFTNLKIRSQIGGDCIPIYILESYDSSVSSAFFCHPKLWVGRSDGALLSIPSLCCDGSIHHAQPFAIDLLYVSSQLKAIYKLINSLGLSITPGTAQGSNIRFNGHHANKWPLSPAFLSTSTLDTSRQASDRASTESFRNWLHKRGTRSAIHSRKSQPGPRYGGTRYRIS
jgi:hypothetical protein